MIAIRADDARALLRQQSAQQALEEYGVTDIHSTTVPVPSSMELGRTGTRQLLQEGFNNGVFFCSSDTLAQGVLAELLSKNIRIPDDIAVIGFGDQVFTMTDEWADYSVNTGVLADNVDPGSITFHIGFTAGEFYIDDVKFYED